MAAAKSTSKAAASKGAAARSEKRNETRAIDFRGLSLTLPAKLPGTVLFDIAEVEGDEDVRGTMKILSSILGANQYQALKAKVAEDEIGFDELIVDLEGLVDSVMGSYGTTPGE